MEKIIFEGIDIACFIEKGTGVSYTGFAAPFDLQNNGDELYLDNENGEFHETFNEKCRVFFKFNINWRGCWDNRIYFKDTEYFGEEMEEMNECYRTLKLYLENKLKNEYPEHGKFM